MTYEQLTQRLNEITTEVELHNGRRTAVCTLLTLIRHAARGVDGDPIAKLADLDESTQETFVRIIQSENYMYGRDYDELEDVVFMLMDDTFDDVWVYWRSGFSSDVVEDFGYEYCYDLIDHGCINNFDDYIDYERLGDNIINWDIRALYYDDERFYVIL